MRVMMAPLLEKLAYGRTPICLKTALRNTENWSVNWKIILRSPRLKYVFDPSPIRKQQVGQSGLLKMSRIERKAWNVPNFLTCTAWRTSGNTILTSGDPSTLSCCRSTSGCRPPLYPSSFGCCHFCFNWEVTFKGFLLRVFEFEVKQL